MVSLTTLSGSVTLLLLLGNVDRGCIFYEYDVGWTGTEEVIKKEKMPKGYGITWDYITWAWREERHDCHRRMGSYLIYTACIF